MAEGKEYGKLTTDQFRRLIHSLPELRNQSTELRHIVAACPESKLSEILTPDFYWAQVYEFPFEQHLALLIAALDKLEWLKEAASLPDPQEEALHFMTQDDDEEWNGGWQGLFEKKHLVGLAFSLQRTILSVMLYQRTLSALVQEVREGHDDSLFDAVRVDRSITACSPIADRIAKAELRGEKKFFIRLRNALKGPQQKHWESYQDLRYALAVLRDLGFKKLSDVQLEELLVKQLKVYPNTYNARRNLRKQYRAAMKISTT